MRLTAVLATIVLVFVLTYLAAWVRLREDVSKLRGQQTWTSINMQKIAATLAIFHREFGRYPDSLEELGQLAENRELFDETGHCWLRDAWGHAFHYERTEESYRLYSFGRDDKEGGDAFDADIEFDPESGVAVLPAFRQSFVDPPGRGAPFSLALAASLCAGVACYLSTMCRKGRCVSMRETATYAVMLTIAAVCVSMALVSVYLAGEYH
jgi:hypothetical protein